MPYVLLVSMCLCCTLSYLCLWRGLCLLFHYPCLCSPGFVSDLMFSPHDDDLLATCSFDNLVKLWRITDPKAQSLPKEPELTLPELPRRGDGLEWNPLVKNLMSVICGNVLRIYDVSTSDKLFGESTELGIIPPVFVTLRFWQCSICRFPRDHP